MNHRFWPTLLGIFVVIAILVTGCGAASPKPANSAPSTDMQRGALPAAPPAPAATAVAGKGAEAGSAAVGDRLVIKTGNITVIVKDVQGSVAAVTALATSTGGYVVGSSSGPRTSCQWQRLPSRCRLTSSKL